MGANKEGDLPYASSKMRCHDYALFALMEEPMRTSKLEPGLSLVKVVAS